MRLVAAPEDATGDSLKNDTPRLLDDAQVAEAAPVEQLAERTPTLLVAFLRFAEKTSRPLAWSTGPNDSPQPSLRHAGTKASRVPASRRTTGA